MAPAATCADVVTVSGPRKAGGTQPNQNWPLFRGRPAVVLVGPGCAKVVVAVVAAAVVVVVYIAVVVVVGCSSGVSWYNTSSRTACAFLHRF
jgi:amino acid transporter